MKRFLKIIPFLFLAVLPLSARDREADLRAEVSFFCDSLRTGRRFGTPGAQASAFYLFRQMRNAGLRTSVQSFSEGGRIGRNVVGVTPGWFRRYIVVGAYFDGLGTLDGAFYPGADSNASGVVALLDLARELPSLCQGGTGIIFVAFDAHNADLAGSKAFLQRFSTEYPISMMVNLDILGSSLAPLHKNQPDYLIALGGGAWRMTLERANRELRLDLAYDYYGSSSFTDLFYRRVSDQRCFLEAGIPSVMFTSGITMNTNRQGDTPETLEYAVLLRRIRLIEAWLGILLREPVPAT
ncbi:MAG: M28 family peptidase [Bacteroidales bacterium]|nr:M28 family peptidase [Bacteroidales bacterium]